MTSESFWIYLGLVGSLLAIFIVILFLLYIYRKNKISEFPIHDERKLRITERSATLAFYIGLFSMSLLMIVSIIGYEFFSIGSLDSINYLMVEILIMSFSYFCIYAYYSKKGST